MLAALLLVWAIPATGCGTGSDANELDVHRELDVAVTDVFAPSDGEGLPVVVMLHGTGGERDVMEPLARAVGEENAVVYLPSWPVIDHCDPGLSHGPERFIGTGGDFLGEGSPEWVDTGDFFLMPADSTRPFDLAFVDGGARRVIFCVADPNPNDPMKWPTVGLWGGSSVRAAAIISSAG